MSLFSLSGGLFYHLKALRYRSSLWAPFRRHVAAWLETALSPSEQLVLVGPSAGHCLPLAHLERFHDLFVLEPDPLARQLLRAQLGRPRMTFEHRDLLVEPLLAGREGLATLLERLPRASLLFCDLLGQVQLELSDTRQQRFQLEFRRQILPLLSKRRWASFHDRWSLDRLPGDPEPPSRVDFPRAVGDDELGTALFGCQGRQIAVLDHGTRELFPELLPRRYFTWQITPRALHIVEAVSG
jgi:hypothetical protein